MDFLSKLFTLEQFDFTKQPQKIQVKIIQLLKTNPSGKMVADYLDEMRKQENHLVQEILEVAY